MNEKHSAESLSGTLILLLAVGLASCGGEATTGGPTAVRDSAGVEIVDLAEDAWSALPRLGTAADPLLSIGAVGGSQDEILFGVTAGAVLEKGRIAVLNAGTREVRVYGPDGALAYDQGEDGEGPGEYRQPRHLYTLPGDSLVVWDRRLLRITVVDPQGAAVRDVRVPGRPTATVVEGVFSDGSFLVFRQRFLEEQHAADQEFQGYYSRYSPSGDSLNAVGVFPWMRMITGAPEGERGGMQVVQTGPPVFDAPTEVAVTGDGVWVGTREENEILWLSRSGETERIVRWEGPDRTVTDAVKEAYYDELRERLAANQAPGAVRGPSRGRPFADEIPSHGELVGRDDGGLWMEEFSVPGLGPTNRWRIFGPTGRPEAVVQLPPESEVLWAGRERVLLRVRDDLGVEYVRLYELVEGA